MGQHRQKYRSHITGSPYGKYTSYEILQYPDAQIVLIENCPCNNKEELLRAERKHIEATANCVNRYIPLRTEKEYREAHKEEAAAYQKEYRAEHQEEAKKYKAEYYQANKEAIEAKHRAYNEKNKEAIAEYRQKMVECECGSSVTLIHLPRHRRTEKHRAFMAKVNQ
jgi:hypothetical protein